MWTHRMDLMLQWLDMGHRYHQWAKSDGLLWKLHGFHKRNARSLVRALLWPNPDTHRFWIAHRKRHKFWTLSRCKKKNVSCFTLNNQWRAPISVIRKPGVSLQLLKVMVSNHHSTCYGCLANHERYCKKCNGSLQTAPKRTYRRHIAILSRELVAGRHRMSSFSSPEASRGPDGIHAMAFTGWLWSYKSVANFQEPPWWCQIPYSQQVLFIAFHFFWLSVSDFSRKRKHIGQVHVKRNRGSQKSDHPSDRWLLITNNLLYHP